MLGYCKFMSTCLYPTQKNKLKSKRRVAVMSKVSTDKQQDISIQRRLNTRTVGKKRAGRSHGTTLLPVRVHGTGIYPVGSIFR